MHKDETAYNISIAPYSSLMCVILAGGCAMILFHRPLGAGLWKAWPTSPLMLT